MCIIEKELIGARQKGKQLGKSYSTDNVHVHEADKKVLKVLITR